MIFIKFIILRYNISLYYMPKHIKNKKDKCCCSRCHKWCELEEFFRKNWKYTASRYFSICNKCDYNKKLPKLQKLIDDLDYKYKK